MAIATAPLTAADVLAAVRAKMVKYGEADDHLRDSTYEFCDAVGYVECRLDGHVNWGSSDLWADLRPSEWARLHELLRAAQDRSVERARAAILEEITAAALAFAAEYPDAPRAGAAA